MCIETLIEDYLNTEDTIYTTIDHCLHDNTILLACSDESTPSWWSYVLDSRGHIHFLEQL